MGITYLISFANGQTDGAAPSAGEASELFNGSDLTGWVNVNGAPDTWSVRDGMIVGQGKPRAFLRTEKMYENFVLQLEWRHLRANGNSGLFVHADALPQVGAPYPRAIEAQIHDGDHGSIFGIRGASIEPITGAGRKGTTPLAAPLEPRCRPAPGWNRYVLTSRGGTLMLEVNGSVVTQAKNCSQQKGYIALQLEEGEVHFRNVRIRELPSSDPPAEKIAQADDGLRSIFDGVSFAGWRYRDEYKGHWTADDGVIRTDGNVQVKRGDDRDLWTEKEYGDFVLVVDWRLPGKPQPKKLPVFTPDGLYARDEQGKLVSHELLDAGDSGIYLRGSDRSQVNIWSQPMGSGDINDYHKDATLDVEIRKACLPKKKADAPFGQWNRFVITARGPRVTVILNGETVIDAADLPGTGSEDAAVASADPEGIFKGNYAAHECFLVVVDAVLARQEIHDLAIASPKIERADVLGPRHAVRITIGRGPVGAGADGKDDRVGCPVAGVFRLDEERAALIHELGVHDHLVLTAEVGGVGPGGEQRVGPISQIAAGAVAGPPLRSGAECPWQRMVL